MFRFLTALKSPKMIIGAVAIVSAVSGTAYYMVSKIQQVGQLQEQLSGVQRELDLVRGTLDAERDRFQEEIRVYNMVISSYVDSINESDEKVRELRRTLVSTNEELQNCLMMNLSEDIMDQIFRRGSAEQ